MSSIRTASLLFTLIIWLPSISWGADQKAPANSDTPLHIAIGQTLQPEQLNRVAEVEGLVTFVGKQGRTTYFEISSETGFMPVTVAHSTGYLTDLLLGSRIRVRGVCTAAYSSVNGKIVSNLLATNLNDITILQLPGETWQRYPISTLSELEQTNSSANIVHLRGKVQTVQQGNSFLLADETGQRIVETRQASSEMAGMEIEALCGSHFRGTNRIFQCGVWRAFITTNQVSLPTLTSAEQILWLTPSDARQAYPVKVRGVITFIRSDRKGGNIQDESGGIFLWRLNLATNYTRISVGDFCEVEGVTSAGSFSPQIYPTKLTVLGAGQIPEPIHPTWGELIQGSLDAQWAEVEGVVLSLTNHTMRVGIKGGRISCLVFTNRTTELGNYLGDVVRVRGVVLSQHDTKRHVVGIQINVPSTKYISVEITPAADPFSTPVTHANDVFTYNPGESDFRQIKVAGQIVGLQNDTYYLMDGTNGIRLLAKTKGNIAVGDFVEAVGFSEIDSPFDRPLLTISDAVIHTMGQRPLPAPIAIAPDDLLNREHDSTWVRVKSKLLGVNEYPDEKVLELQTGTQVYRARLKTTSGGAPALRVGSLLELTGVYAVSNDKLVSFELLLNSPGDIGVLELPPWWTPMHTLVVVTAMALLIIMVLVWNSALHQQVNRRTRELTVEIAERKRTENELIETRSQHLVEQERTRIARDLHDDLGSRVTQLVLLNELTLQNRVSQEGAMEHAREISDAARQMIQSLDETVWAVNPRNDKLPHLLNYLGQFAIGFLKHSNMRCRIDFPNELPNQTVSAEVRHNLFLALKEALNNAIRHAQASEVWLHAVVTNDSLTLTVQDNGRGLKEDFKDPSADGLQNMRQRMEAVGGRFIVESSAGTGVKLILTIPWNSSSKNEAMRNGIHS